ncbi:hypothetical protein Msil_3581 [Methylocella silvestris BL2]|uniref:Uncharacterized protein n=1 Tax=Methylocella silvestris (strain DSM 15510 / CIP 108128 / LMG 27833 / NCIMB 13906 / BL2) TaxID=395965 RepID=B8EIX6_METSB|nr:hypothetical protein Msil_3581 [Methylocella silvestris BL2]
MLRTLSALISLLIESNTVIGLRFLKLAMDGPATTRKPAS